MPAGKPRVLNIPAHGAFADCLAAGLAGGFPFGFEGELALARTLVILPNRRAVRAVTEAFVRHSGGALLLPRLYPLGEIDEDAAPLPLGTFAAEAARGEPMDPFARLMQLMPLVERWQKRTGRRTAKVDTLRYAEALARALDLMRLWEVDPQALAGAVDADMASHWSDTARFLDIVREEWPKILSAAGRADRIEQRQDLLRVLASSWRKKPPPFSVIAAGIGSAEPAAAELLASIARARRGAVVLQALDLDMQAAEWEALTAAAPHPQAPLKALLDLMSVARGEVQAWPATSERDGAAQRTAMLNRAAAAPAATAGWQGTATDPAAIDGFAGVDARTPAEEAMVIALAMRRALETPGRTAALVTPDRDLARRTAAHLRRWRIEIDDSAGMPLALTPPGAFLRLALEAAQSAFAPVPLLALLKHPLAGPAEARSPWLAKVRRLDLALRGVRPPRGLQGITHALSRAEKERADWAELRTWWQETAAALRPVATLFQRRVRGDLQRMAALLRELVAALSDERFWDGQAGRAASEALAALERHGADGGDAPAADLPALLGAILGQIAVRPAYGRHPRLAIYGLLEARLQRADLMVLGGLNEGVWPQADSFDPWLPPKVRRALGLPPTDRADALAAHDFLTAAAAPEVLLTRARRNAEAPTVPSRFWLRLEALLGDGFIRDGELAALARGIDACDSPHPAARPEPRPPVADRPRRISVTQVEVLRADPYQFYARHMLGLRKLDELGKEADAAERGNIVHGLLESLQDAGGMQDAAARAEMIDRALGPYADHPVLRALWRPRVERMLDFASESLRRKAEEGWRVAGVECRGSLNADGVELTGKADLVLMKEGALGIADYKTGAPPAQTKILAGYADQLGLLAWLAEDGRLEHIPAAPIAQLAYWRLSGGLGSLGKIWQSGTGTYRRAWGDLPAYLDAARRRFRETAAMYLTGDAPFTARLRPEYAPAAWNEYDLLARVAEWEGRGRQ